MTHAERPTGDGGEPTGAAGAVQGFDLGEAQAWDPREAGARRLAALGEMTGGIVHDLSNFFALIEAKLSLAEASDEPQTMRASIAAAREALGRGARLTTELLNFARQRECEPRANDAGKLLRNLELFLNYGAGPRIAVVLDLAPDLPSCLIDPSQFNAALLNLVANARDAMPAGGRIEIGAAPWRAEGADPAAAPRYVRVRVRDDGQGMSEELARRVFDPFFTTKGMKGTGLGLSQVLAFMRSVGGDVRVASERGRGTTFDLFFPVVAHASEETGEGRRKRELDLELDRELEATFPASDPPKVTRGRGAAPGVLRPAAGPD